MAFNQWRILNMLKHSLSKLSNEKSIPDIRQEFLQMLQKLSPLLSKDIGRFFQKGETSSNEEIKSPETSKKDESQLPAVFHDFKSKIGIKKDDKENFRRWKQSSIESESNILLKLDQLLGAIEFNVSQESLLYLIEQLIEYLKKHPGVKSKAVKSGAIRVLLRIRSKEKHELIQASLREALVLLGHADPVSKMGIRILSIDGGGIRGLLILEMLKKLEEITGKKTYELFDFFCGVSTGAILAFSIGIHQRSLDEISHRYAEISKEVFKQSSWKGTGSLVWSQSYYDTALWEKKLQEHLGTPALVSTARDPKCPKKLFAPWKVQSQYMGSCTSEVWQAARASAAAPTYFEEFKLGNFLHQDGGILVNNPTAIALHEVRLLWPNTPIQCVVSFGTGRTVPSPVELSRSSGKTHSTLTATSWTDKFLKILDSATDTEAVHIMLNDLLPDNVYYRFNPYLTELISMVETDSNKLEQLKRDAIMYLRRNEDKFQEAAKVLMIEKSLKCKMEDYVKTKRDLLGFRSCFTFILITFIPYK